MQTNPQTCVWVKASDQRAPEPGRAIFFFLSISWGSKFDTRMKGKKEKMGEKNSKKQLAKKTNCDSKKRTRTTVMVCYLKSA